MQIAETNLKDLIENADNKTGNVLQYQFNDPSLLEELDSNDDIKSVFYIRNKRGQKVPYVPNASQLFYRSKRTRRNLILKGRQQGLSKEIDADQLADCLKKSTNAVVVSHESEASKRLFAAVRYYVDNMEVKPNVSIDSNREMKFPKTGSNYFVGTAGARAFGRGDTIDRAHLSEAAFYPDLKMILTGISEAAEYGQIDIETTPNGREEFYDMWKKAKAGLSPYTCIFIPWFIHEEYDINKLTEKEKQGLSPRVQAMFNMPDEEFDYTEEEKALCKRVEHEHGIILTVGQLKWRRYKIWDKGELFFQEYPEDDESCFLQAGRSVFKHLKVDPTLKINLAEPEKMKEADRKRLLGGVNEFGKKIRPKTLFAGIDPAEGTTGGDSHVFSVIEANSPYHRENGAVVIYELHSNEPINVFLGKVKKIMDTFDIILGIEKQGVGVAMTNKAAELDIPFQEWNTTGTSRPVMISDLEESYRKEELIETYTEAEGEARDMIYNKQNRAEHPNGKHDDRVFSRCIALAMFKMPQAGISFF